MFNSNWLYVSVCVCVRVNVCLWVYVWECSAGVNQPFVTQQNLQTPTTFSSTLQLVHNNLFWGICVAAFRHHFSALQIYAVVLLTDTARLPALSINRVFLSVWLTAAPFMSLTFPAGYWISKHTPACIFCSSTIIKSYTQPAAPPPLLNETWPRQRSTAL